MKTLNFAITTIVIMYSLFGLAVGMDIQQKRILINSQIMQTQQQLSQRRNQTVIHKMRIRQLDAEIDASVMHPAQSIYFKSLKAKALKDLKTTEDQIEQLTKNENDLIDIQKTINR